MAVIIKRSKRYKEAATKAVLTPVTIDAAIDAVKAFPPTKFDQSVELIFNLGIDAKQADQMIRGSLSLPHGVGKTKRVVAFCGENLVPVALAAGALRAGGQELWAVGSSQPDGLSDAGPVWRVYFLWMERTRCGCNRLRRSLQRAARF